MITLYHCISARSFRVLWMLEELGVPQATPGGPGGDRYELKMLPFPPRVLQRSYFEVNPLGTVPAMLDDGMRMTESAAICQYLAQRFSPTPLNVEPAEADYGAYLNYLHFGEATLTFPQTLVLRYAHFEPEARRSPQIADDYTKWFLARLRTLEQHLSKHAFLCADRFTAADVSVGYALMLAQRLALANRFTTGIAAYWQRLSQRDGYLRAMQAQDAAARAQGVSPLSATRTAP